MGLLADLSPEGTAGDAAELEAELLALVGGGAAPGEKPKGKGERCRPGAGGVGSSPVDFWDN